MSLSLVAIFGAGVLTFASPCVLPLMPIYLTTIVGSSLERARLRRTLAVAAGFASGLSLVFIVLGALASTIGKALTEQRLWITLISGALMIVFGLRALGLLRIRAFDKDVRPTLSRVVVTPNVGAAFLFGAAFALGWSPCIGPVLASVLSYAAANADSPWRGAGYLAVYSAGMALPLFALAIAASRIPALLKRFRSAVPVLERITGIALLLIGAWTMIGPLQDYLSTQSSEPEIALKSDAVPETAAACTSESAHCGLSPATANELPGQVEEFQGPHLLEFSARECPACRRMRPVVDKFVATCSGLSERLVRVDVSTAKGRALAQRHAVVGTPTFVLVDEQGVERARILGETSSQEVAAAVERAFGVSCAG